MERDAGRGEQAEIIARRELHVFQKTNQEKLYVSGICRHPLPSLWGVCVYTIVGWKAAVVARALTVSSLKTKTPFNSAFYCSVSNTVLVCSQCLMNTPCKDLCREYFPGASSGETHSCQVSFRAEKPNYSFLCCSFQSGCLGGTCSN